jgi:hypothetical protein
MVAMQIPSGMMISRLARRGLGARLVDGASHFLYIDDQQNTLQCKYARFSFTTWLSILFLSVMYEQHRLDYNFAAAFTNELAPFSA